MASKRDDTPPVGVSGDLSGRASVHKEGLTPGFTSRYGCKRLVWSEEHFDIRDAITREKTIKRWPRTWKTDLIEAIKPDWNELYTGMGWAGLAPPLPEFPAAYQAYFQLLSLVIPDAIRDYEIDMSQLFQCVRAISHPEVRTRQGSPCCVSPFTAC